MSRRDSGATDAVTCFANCDFENAALDSHSQPLQSRSIYVHFASKKPFTINLNHYDRVSIRRPAGDEQVEFRTYRSVKARDSNGGLPSERLCEPREFLRTLVRIIADVRGKQRS